ncbi:hypothetical protein [Hymenobacter bucti]|uniref:Uncharacterized protein n=1 Tax=Hymenobacter bucti TaxID=1844114 RepID=A0ABW4QTP2_9BACT
MGELIKKLLLTNSIAQRLWAWRSEGLRQSHLCYNPHCPNSAQAIKSHILQKNGILNYVSEDIGNGKEIIELRYNDYFKQDKTRKIYDFVKAGVTKSNEVAFWGFCPECDRNLFSSLEVGPRDFTNRRNQTLLTYRALMRDICKQEYNIAFYTKVRTSANVTREARMYCRDAQLPQAVQLRSNYELRYRLESFLFGGATDYVFNYLVFCLPLVKLAHSAIIGGPHHTVLNGAEANELLAWKPDYISIGDASQYRFTGPLGTFNLIPTANELIVVIGYDENMQEICGVPIKSINSIDNKSKFKLISDILITRGKSWCMAPSLYENLKSAGHDDLILDSITYFGPDRMKHLTPAINMFDGQGLF